MNVLAVLNWLKRGGIETGLLSVVPELRKHGIRMDFCCLGGEGVLDADFRALGSRVFHFPRRMAWSRGYREVTSVLEQESYAAVHSQFGYTSAGIARAATDRRVPVVVSVHSSVGPAPALRNWPIASFVRQTWLNWHRRRTLPIVAWYLGVSESCVDSALPNWRTRATKCRILDNGIQFPVEVPNRAKVRQTLGIEEGRPLLLHVGSFRYAKNHSGLLEIFRVVLAREPRALLVLVGDGPLRESVQSFVESQPWRNSVLFLGTQNNVWQFYSATDVLVFPSHFEGSPNVLVEAMGCGVPIVASRIAPHVEAVHPSQHDFMFELPDYSRAAELVLMQLHSNYASKQSWVSESQLYSRRRFSLQRHVNELVALYRGLESTHTTRRNAA
jgi:glycosyltransferase EpsF